ARREGPLQPGDEGDQAAVLAAGRPPRASARAAPLRRALVRQAPVADLCAARDRRRLHRPVRADLLLDRPAGLSSLPAVDGPTGPDQQALEARCGTDAPVAGGPDAPHLSPIVPSRGRVPRPRSAPRPAPAPRRP